MYRLEVYHTGSEIPDVVERPASATDAMARIPMLLAEHDDCERVVVVFNGARLFAVDCKGNRIDS